MIENNNFPWYLQQSSVFVGLYTGFFDVAVAASPLGMGDAFNIDEMTGAMLFRLGTYWGMTGSPYVWDGLIYGIDKWSEFKTWTGGLRQLGEDFYAGLIKAKAFAYGRPYSLNTLKGVFERVFDGQNVTCAVREQDMEITISLTGERIVLETFIQARAFDLSFIGKPVGIKVNWEYNYE